MGRLKSIAPRLGTLKPRLAVAGDARVELDRRRGQRPWRRWYWTARWKALRAAVLLRDLYTCQWPGCGRIEGDSAKLVADHRVPHRGDAALFWDEANLWTLCASCHSGAKQRAEVRADAGIGRGEGSRG